MIIIRAWALFELTVLLRNLCSVFCMSLFLLQVLDCALALLYVCGFVTGSDFHSHFFIQGYHLMLGHRVDACASHVMLCASYGCFFITLDALRIVWCLCIAGMELGAPWVTEASLLRGIFLFFLCLVAFGICIYSSLYLSGLRWILHSISHTGCDGCVDFLCCAIDCCH